MDIAKHAPMFKRLSLQAVGKKIGQYGGQKLGQQSFMPQNPWVMPAIKGGVGFVGATVVKNDTINSIAEGLFQSAIEDVIDQVVYMTGVPVQEQAAQEQAVLKQEFETAQNNERGRVTPPLPTNNTGTLPPPLDKLNIPGLKGFYDDPHEAMMAAVEDMIVNIDEPHSNKNYSSYLGALDVMVEGIQYETSISS
jgi:hypothetical protein